MKEQTLKVIMAVFALCFFSGLVWVGLSFKGAFGFTNGSYDVSFNISADEMWQIYLMFGLVIGGAVGLLVTFIIFIRYSR